ncbi:MAG: hypothetical protein ACRDJE_19675 [Dehalococcoidia bacterium]
MESSAEEAVSAATSSGEAATTIATEETVVAVTNEGVVTGAGLERMYTTRPGDRMEDVAAYFYGDAVQKQRLIDDNPWLAEYDGKEMPGGLEIHVGEDPNRGDAVSTS